MTETHVWVYTQKYALQLNLAPSTETTMTTVHRLGRNETSSNWGLGESRLLCICFINDPDQDMRAQSR